MGKTTKIAACASGCAYHSTVGGCCQTCGGPLTNPATVTGQQVRDLVFARTGDRAAAYDANRAAAIEFARAHRS